MADHIDEGDSADPVLVDKEGAVTKDAHAHVPVDVGGRAVQVPVDEGDDIGAIVNNGDKGGVGPLVSLRDESLY